MCFNITVIYLTYVIDIASVLHFCKSLVSMQIIILYLTECFHCCRYYYKKIYNTNIQALFAILEHLVWLLESICMSHSVGTGMLSGILVHLLTCLYGHTNNWGVCLVRTLLVPHPCMYIFPLYLINLLPPLYTLHWFKCNHKYCMSSFTEIIY